MNTDTDALSRIEVAAVWIRNNKEPDNLLMTNLLKNSCFFVIHDNLLFFKEKPDAPLRLWIPQSHVKDNLHLWHDGHNHNGQLKVVEYNKNITSFLLVWVERWC